MKQRRGGCFLFTFLFSVVLSTVTLAQTALFDVKQTNQSFESIQKKLEMHKDVAGISPYVDQLEQLRSSAKKCVSTTEEQLKLLDGLLRSTQNSAIKEKFQEDTKFLEDRRTQYAKKLADCRLFVYRSDEVLVEYKEKLQKLNAGKILKRSTPIWEIQGNHWWQSLADVKSDPFLQLSGLNELTSNQLTIGIVFLVFIGFAGFYLRVVLKRVVTAIQHTHVLFRSSIDIASSMILPTLLLGFCSMYFDLVFSSISPVRSVELISYAAFMLVLSLALAKFLFYPCERLPGLFSMPVILGRAFYHRVSILLWFLFLGYVTAAVLRGQAFPSSFIELTRTTFLTIVSALGAWIFLLLRRLQGETQTQQKVGKAVSDFILILLLALVITEWLGYHELAIFSIEALCLTAIYTVIAVALWRLSDALYQWVDNKQFALACKVHRFFGVKMSKKMRELMLIKLSLQFIILCVYAILFFKSWGFSANFIDSLVSGLMDGFKLAGMSVVPSRIVFAILTFSVILLLGRSIASTFAKKHESQGEVDKQIAISTITIYIAFLIALIIGLLMTGVDFTGLAIIAGALSVGVGMGLQSIVSNFVSGLILLIEKPIKPGDRIVIGDIEGFVKKIRIRSTQISTTSREDVIVPNASLIAQPVKNYMFRDHHLRISCQVGVAYGSDLQLVKKVLLDVASKHEGIMQEPPNSPSVLFSEFGQSCLVFTLRFIVHHVNDRRNVASDVNFEIDAAFRKHNITIAFPQMDVHIKQDMLPANQISLTQSDK